jgi:hypothetical protein
MPIIGKPLEGRQFKTDGGNNNAKTIAIEAPNGDLSTAQSATPFLEFTNAKIDGSDKDGTTNLTKYNVDSISPSGSDVQGVLISINSVKYWMPVFKAD